jgi:hypothetical protein
MSTCERGRGRGRGRVRVGVRGRVGVMGREGVMGRVGVMGRGRVGVVVEAHAHLLAERGAELGEDAPLGDRVGARGEVVVVVVLGLLDELGRDLPLAQRRLDHIHALLVRVRVRVRVRV